MGDGGGPSPSAIKRSLTFLLLFILFVFFTPQLILQKSNGLFRRKLIIAKGSRGGPTFFPGGGVSTFFPGVGVQLLIP